MKTVKTSLTFDDALWKEFKKKCIDQNKRYADVIQELMRKWLDK